MKARFLLLAAGFAIVAAQSMTVYADDMMSSDDGSDTYYSDDAEQGGSRGTCSCVFVRVVTDVIAISEAEAKMVALKVPPTKKGEVAVSCVKQAVMKYTCTLQANESTRRSRGECADIGIKYNKMYVPKPYKSVTCSYTPDAA